LPRCSFERDNAPAMSTKIRARSSRSCLHCQKSRKRKAYLHADS
jgi:hypothetical protein